MRRILLSVLLIWSVQQGMSQSCTATTFYFDLSSSIDTTVVMSSNRNGDCCTGTNCIRFDLILNPACSFVNFDVQNPAPNGSAYYQINCGPQTSLATPICIVGLTHVVITYCKPGNDAPDYIITAAGAIQGSPDTTIKRGCTGKMGVKNLIESTVNWTSIYPGPQGSYNSYLSCVTGCDTVNVTPLTGAPDYIDYQVSGNRLCGPVVYDTIRIYTAPQFTVAITPVYPEICPNGGTATITASAANGQGPYHFLWNTTDTTNTITVNSAGYYYVGVTDNNGCLPVIDSVNVTPLAVPPTPTVITNSPLCVGTTLNLNTATVANATYSWTGPNGFTSNLQNPVINNVTVSYAGNYFVTVTVNNCTSLTGSGNVVVNTIPAAPVASSNTPVCQGSGLNLLASNIANANYNWTGPNGFSSSVQNPSIPNVNFANAGVYSVTATVNGCTGAAGSTSVSINPLPNLSTSSNSPVCSGTTLSLFANSDPGAMYSWVGPIGFSSSSQNPTIPNAPTNASGNYTVTATLNGCITVVTIAVTVKQTPSSPVASNNAPICDGSNLNLSASAIANAIYSWTGPNGFSSSSQNPSIANASLINAGNYLVTATVNGCTSSVANTNVIINPIPISPNVGSNSPLCAGSNISLNASTVAGASYSWLGPNGFSSNNQNPSISNASVNNSGNYSVTATANGCTSNPSSINVVVNAIPAAPVLSNNSPACVGSNVNLAASTINGATYTWTGPNGFNSASQNPTLSSVTISNSGSYSANVTVNGCVSTSSSTSVTINPIPNSPVASNNGSICAGSNLNLSASNISGASYSWTGPNGFNSISQNNVISNAGMNAAGQYFVTATVNGCTSAPATTTAVIFQLSVTNAGANQTICSNNPSVNLNGSITGGSSTGIWTSNGSGSFSPTATNPNCSYIPSGLDKATGSVSLTFTSTNNGACSASSSSIVVSFVALPNASAGNDSAICSNKTFQLKGIISNATGGIWSSSGSGSFSPSNTNLNATYSPGQSDISNGKAILTLTTTGNQFCPADTKSFVLILRPAPTVDAGDDKILVVNQSVLITPAMTGQGLTVLWTPAMYLDNDSSLFPRCTPATDMYYRVVVTDKYGCTAQDDIFVKVLKLPVIPNVFTPNNDGINDTWQIKSLADYADCDVEIFNRYGQIVFRSTGYNKPWDGTVNGKPVPAATYYYIINLKFGLKPFSGFVDIVR